MLLDIAYFPIFGRPLIVYLGIITLGAFLFTAIVAVLNVEGIQKIPFRWHPRVAIFSVVLGIIHGILGIAAYF